MEWRRWAKRTALGGAVAVVVFGAVSARMFVWPAIPAPSTADAVVVFGGDGNRFATGQQLVHDGLAPLMVVSNARGAHGCDEFEADVELICYTPEPFSTRGEARFVADLARERGWGHVIVVTSVGQSQRARLRLERCFPGEIDEVAVRPDALRVVRDVVYEWGATFKALVLEPHC